MGYCIINSKDRVLAQMHQVFYPFLSVPATNDKEIFKSGCQLQKAFILHSSMYFHSV